MDTPYWKSGGITYRRRVAEDGSAFEYYRRERSSHRAEWTATSGPGDLPHTPCEDPARYWHIARRAARWAVEHAPEAIVPDSVGLPQLYFCRNTSTWWERGAPASPSYGPVDGILYRPLRPEGW